MRSLSLIYPDRPARERFPACLVIDYDNAANLEVQSGELKERTVCIESLLATPAPYNILHTQGTPLYIARSVSLGMVLANYVSIRGIPMPELTGDALRLYTAVYGQERYDRYNDEPQSGKCHGGFPPMLDPDSFDPTDLPAFVHRAEHDVESVYWTMVYALLRAQPAAAPREDYAPQATAVVWDILLAHHIPEQDYTRKVENRDVIINGPKWEWLDMFCADMKDVAVLLWQISQHVRAEYALWEGELPRDHLHEAVQRLILAYLVEHRDNPIELDPDHLRPTAQRPAAKRQTQTGTQLSRTQATRQSGSRTTGQVPSGSGTANSRNRGSGKGSKQTATRKGSTKSANAASGPSRSSKQSRDETRTTHPDPIVANPKRKSDSKPSRSSKRLKALSGAPVRPSGQDEDDEGGDEV